MPNESGNNTTNNKENKFPNQGNFSALQNNAGKLGQVKDIASNSINNSKNANQGQSGLTDNPTGLADNVKKEVGKKAIEAAASAYAGPAGGKIAQAAMNSKLGNKVMNTATNLTKNPIRRFGDFLNKKAEAYADNGEETAEETAQQEETTTESAVPEEVKSMLVPVAITGGFGCLGNIMMIAIIASVILAPILLITNFIGDVKDGFTNFWNNIGYFFKGCEDAADCATKEQNSFYQKLKDVHEEYQKDYNITLNIELITATLTYTDPMATMEQMVDDDGNLKYMDFKKREKKIEKLAEQMVGKGKTCVDSLGTIVAQYKEEEVNTPCPPPNPEYYYKTPEDEAKGKTTKNVVKSEEWLYLDEDKYKKYLEDEFIKDFYFKNVDSDAASKKIPQVIRDIYARAEMARYLTSSENSSANFTANNTQVVLTDCSGNIELETISLYEYLQGILYVEGYATNRSEEFLKVQAVASKTYLYAINGATPDSIPTTLRIRSCQMNQVYCSVEKGCHNMNDGKESTYDSYDTLASGPDVNGGYFRPPITDVATLEKIKRAIDSTLTEFVIKDNKFVTTQYRSTCTSLTCDSTTNILDQKKANEMIISGSTYKEVLNYFYNGEIKEITLGAAGYPLDLVNNVVTSAYGWRVHPIKKICRTHGGTDIAAPGDSNIYSIADGVVINNYYHSSYGNVTIIGHGSDGNGNYQYYSLYAHQIRLSKHVSVGQSVKAGQIIGNVGSTGDSTGNHLHIEIYTLQNGLKVRQDPVEYFKGVELTGQVGGALYGSEAQCKSCLMTYGANNC